MRPSSSMGSSFGIRWDPRMWSTRLAVVTFVVSVLVMGAHHLPATLDTGVTNAFVLSAANIRGHFMVWELLTYEFVEVAPLQLLFMIYALVVFGAGVEERVGSRVFLYWFFGLSLAGSLVTLGLSFFWPIVAGISYVQGADAVEFGLLVVWAALNRGSMIRFMMVLPMSADLLKWITLGLVVLGSIASHPALFVPHYAAFATAEAATRGGFDLSPRRLYLKLRAWQIDRQLRKRSSKFTVIPGGGEEPQDKGPGGYLN